MSIVQRPAGNGKRGQIGYFSHVLIGDKHVGAVMVTNQIGVPVEFKYTEPVVATRIHRVLYGSSMERYLRETVIRERLAREVHSEPDFFITSYDEKEYLGPFGDKPMMAVQRIHLTPGETAGTFTRVREREAMVELEDGPMVRIAFSSAEDSVQQEMLAWLREMARGFDILEPIDRINSALKMLCGEQQKV